MDETFVLASFIFNAIVIIAGGIFGVFKIVQHSSCSSKCFSFDIEIEHVQS